MIAGHKVGVGSSPHSLSRRLTFGAHIGCQLPDAVLQGIFTGVLGLAAGPFRHVSSELLSKVSSLITGFVGRHFLHQARLHGACSHLSAVFLSVGPLDRVLSLLGALAEIDGSNLLPLKPHLEQPQKFDTMFVSFPWVAKKEMPHFFRGFLCQFPQFEE